MSIEDLRYILKKEPVISTWPARSLSDSPEKVEKDYLVHARTHISLGDTRKYVDTALKWVSGVNKGTFVGAVLGHYGEGKTSFLVHLWSESQEANVFTIPPFEWSAYEEIGNAVSGWVQYVLGKTHPGLAKKMQRLHDEFQQGTLEDLAKEQSKRTGKDYETVLKGLKGWIDSGQVVLKEMSAPRLLDMVRGATEIVKEAGFKGLLILLDEPEVAAKKLGNESVQHFIFDLTNELIRRQGNYGVFLSMPQNFYAVAQTRFSALSARLEARKCFPRLSDIYGPDFAKELWARYVQEFDLGTEGENLVHELTLKAIGQVGSSINQHLAYGPRTVVSAFSRMVERYQNEHEVYTPQDFIQDIRDSEILVQPDYRSALLQVLDSPEVKDEFEGAIMILGAFPSGLNMEECEALGIRELLTPFTGPGGIVRKGMSTMRLRALSPASHEGAKTSPIEEMIQEIDSEFAPGKTAMENALSAFTKDILPEIFKPREGHQLAGWQDVQPMESKDGVFFGTKKGAFAETANNYPCRAAMIVNSCLNASLDRIPIAPLDQGTGPTVYDFFFHLRFRWHDDQDEIANVIEISEPSSSEKAITVRLCFDLTQGLIEYEKLEELVGSDRLSPLWVLNLFDRMRNIQFDKQFEASWIALRKKLLRDLVGLLFNATFSKSVLDSVEDACIIRGKSTTNSGACRPPIPEDVDH